jgi:hypothetical protein
VGVCLLNGAATTSKTMRRSITAESSASRCLRKRRQINALRLSGRAEAE